MPCNCKFAISNGGPLPINGCEKHRATDGKGHHQPHRRTFDEPEDSSAPEEPSHENNDEVDLSVRLYSYGTYKKAGEEGA